jgi:threonine aldolase
VTNNPYAFAFASDNTAPATPEAMDAIVQANSEAFAPSYGADRFTQKAIDAIRGFFECPQAEVFFVFSGTAANALAIAACRQPYESVFCTHEAHIEKDESAAPEFFAQGLKLHLVGDARGDKIDLQAMQRILAGNRGMHSPQPRLISISQCTEFGTCYAPEELRELHAFAKARQLLLHMDGARFANALAASTMAPADLSWRAGIDVMSLGGTKNGVGCSEVVVFFRPELAAGFLNRRKQGGQLLSKMRMLSAPWLAALANFRSRAAHANTCAASLSEGMLQAGLQLAFPTQANGVFVHLPDALVAALQAQHWHFYKFYQDDVYRFMCAWNTAPEAIQALLSDIRECNHANV